MNALDKAKELAEASGSDVLIGVRPNGTWFAHCDNIEWDGATPMHAVDSVIRDVQRAAQRAAEASTRNAVLAAARSAKLKAL